MKDKGVAYLLWCGGLIGVCGLHRFYIGKIGTGILWLCTLGLLGFGQLIDLFTLSGQVDTENLRSGAIALLPGRGRRSLAGKRCPYCAEMIQSRAVLCRYCGQELEEVVQVVKSPAPQRVVRALGPNELECPECSAGNSINAAECRECGASLM